MVGDIAGPASPRRGVNLKQPGGWDYNILPFLELGAVHDLGLGQGTVTSSTRTEFSQRVATPITTLICPTRRSTTVYPYLMVGGGVNGYNNVSPQPTAVGRCDYAACMGETDVLPYYIQAVPATLAAGDASPFGDANGSGWTNAGGHRVNGIIGLDMQVRMADITDGTSCTYMVGEKNLNVDCYTTGQASGDNQGWDAGCTADNERIVGTLTSGTSTIPTPAYCQPAGDVPGVSNDLNFGSSTSHVIRYGLVRWLRHVHQLQH